MGHFEMSEGTLTPDYHCVKSRSGDRLDKDFVLLFSMFTIFKLKAKSENW